VTSKLYEVPFRILMKIILLIVRAAFVSEECKLLSLYLHIEAQTSPTLLGIIQCNKHIFRKANSFLLLYLDASGGRSMHNGTKVIIVWILS